MDHNHSGDVFKHLEKQKELLTDAYRSISHELHNLQEFIGDYKVEEEMLMRKYYEFVAAQGLSDKITLRAKIVDEKQLVLARLSGLIKCNPYKKKIVQI